MAHATTNTGHREKAQSTFQQGDLSALVASRICHDLISPMGAIDNGLELLQLSQGITGPEFDLIAQSITQANTRLRLYRLAFGMVGDEQMISRNEIDSMLKALGASGRHSFRWTGSDHLNRRQSKLVFLLLLCLESALPWGGEIVIGDAPGGLRLTALSDRMKLDEALWNMVLSKATDETADLSAAKVHFALIAQELRAQEASVTMVREASGLRLHLRCAS
ncbi:MAG: histidine phosphotransferase [Rhodobacteraceae bacterium]|nr:MAG: histidine phosphotransferase [Paracoccaceae bacterium]